MGALPILAAALTSCEIQPSLCAEAAPEPDASRACTALNEPGSSLLGRYRYGQTLATLSAAAVNYISSVLGAHSDQKPMRSFSACFAWLIRSFHGPASALCASLHCSNPAGTPPAAGGGLDHRQRKVSRSGSISLRFSGT